MIFTNPTPEPTVTVMLATCSRLGMLRTCLASIAEQVAPVAFDIVVVDDRSTDGTAAYLAEFAANSPVPLRVIAGEGKGVAAARNCGAAAVRAPWILSFDDDQIALPGWLDAMYSAAVATDAACVGGNLTLDLPPGHSIEDLAPRARRVLGEHVVTSAGAGQAYAAGMLPATNNALIRRDVFEELHGFDERFTEGGEDADFFDRLRAAGYRLWHEPAARALHCMTPARLSVGNLRWTSVRMGAGDARLQLRRQQGGQSGSAAAMLLRRFVATVARDLPQLALATLRRDRAAALNTRCSLWYSRGLLHALLELRRDNGARTSAFMRSMDFRRRNGERS